MVAIKSIKFKDRELTLNQEGESRNAEFNGRTYQGLGSLIEENNVLKESQYSEQLAEIALFLTKGGGFEMITSGHIKEESDIYKKRQLISKNQPLSTGSFNLNEVKAPRYDGQQLIFYAVDRSTGIPQKVSVHLEKKPVKVEYSNLPYAEQR